MTLLPSGTCVDTVIWRSRKPGSKTRVALQFVTEEPGGVRYHLHFTASRRRFTTAKLRMNVVPRAGPRGTQNPRVAFSGGIRAHELSIQSQGSLALASGNKTVVPIHYPLTKTNATLGGKPNPFSPTTLPMKINPNIILFTKKNKQTKRGSNISAHLKCDAFY